MKTTAKLRLFFAAILLAAVSICIPSGARAGDPAGDEIIIYRAVESSKTSTYREADGGSVEKERERETTYYIINLTTRQYRTVKYYTEIQRDMDNRRIRVKIFQAIRGNYDLQVLFEANQTTRKRLMILSEEGTGMGNNFEYSDNGSGGEETGVLAETLLGTVKVQRIRTEAGIVECLAPSTIRGPHYYEHNQNNLSGDSTREVRDGKKTLRIDKRLIRDAKDAGATDLEGFQDAVISFLQSKGYSDNNR